MKHEMIIDPADMADHKLGLEIIRVLGLRRKRENGRIETTHGGKNPCGLTRTLRSLTGDAERIASLEAACSAALAVLKANFPLEHGNPQVGEAWGKLETALKP